MADNMNMMACASYVVCTARGHVVCTACAAMGMVTEGTSESSDTLWADKMTQATGEFLLSDRVQKVVHGDVRMHFLPSF